MEQSWQRPRALVLGSDFKALGVIRSLGRHGIRSTVVDTLPRSAWFSRYVSKRIRWHGSLGDEAFLSFLLALSKQPELDGAVLYPMQDEIVELIARNSARLAPHYRLVTPPWAVVRWACDKRLTYRMAAELGIPFPRTWYPSCEEELRSLAITFPAIIKPATSVRLQYALRLKALPANNDEELLAQYRLARDIMAADEVLIQEMIPGNGEHQYSLGAYCEHGTVLRSMTARRRRQYPIDYGLSSCFVEAVEIPPIVPLAEKLLRFMGVSGMVEVEFKYDERVQQYKLLDINLRPWGWHTLCIACGLDFPYMQYCAAAALDPGPLPAVPRYGTHWVRLLTDIPAGWQEMRAGMTTPGAYLRSLMGRTTFSVFDLRDPLPAPGDLLIALSRVMHRSKDIQRSKHSSSHTSQ
jgi:D-aspartate ligase